MMEPASMERALLNASLDLCANLAAHDRYERLLRIVKTVLPCDATVFLKLDSDGALIPVVALGLVPDVLGRRFDPKDHPRLQTILDAQGPVQFPDDCPWPDPYDGLFLDDIEACHRVHSCMGCSLRVEGQVIGVLTMDALRSDAFASVDNRSFELFGVLLAAGFHTAELVDRLEKTAHQQRQVSRQLLQEANERAGTEFLGISTVAQEIRREIELLANSDLTVLIQGETGVGKEVVARAIHTQSPRSKQAMICVNCAALPESIAESELFGHCRGAFTGAIEERLGKFEVADGGTLFFDEVGELPLTLQPKLLRALQTGEVQRVGSDRIIRVNVRIIAATNRDLEKEVEEGRFRADLYHRLSVYPLHIAPLRERSDDVLVLSGFFLDNARIRLGLGPIRLTPAAQTALIHYDWPGNVRGLEHVLLRAAVKASHGVPREQLVVIDLPHLALPQRARTPTSSVTTIASTSIVPQPFSEAVEAFKRQLLHDAIQSAGGNLSQAAKELKLDRGNLHRLAKRLGVTVGMND